MQNISISTYNKRDLPDISYYLRINAKAKFSFSLVKSFEWANRSTERHKRHDCTKHTDLLLQQI